MSALLLSLLLPARAADPEPAAEPASEPTAEPAAEPAPAPEGPLAVPAADPAEAPETPDLPDAPDAPGAPEAPETPETPDAPEAPVRPVIPDPTGTHGTFRRTAVRRGRAATMEPWGQLQVFTTLWDQDEDVQADPASYGDPEADPGFQVARGRFGFTGRLPARDGQRVVIDYGLSVGIATPFDALVASDAGVGIVDAYGRGVYRSSLGPTTLALGLVKVPFSRELLMSSQDLAFQERAVGPNEITALRDAGALASQAFRLSDAEDAPQIVLHVGAFNGNGSFLGDRDPGLLYAGRLEYATGETYKTWDPDGGISAGLAASGLLDDALATRSVGWNLDGLLRFGPWSIMGELGQVTLTPTDSTVGLPVVLAKTTQVSWLAATSLWIGIDGDQGVEIAARASSFDDNTRLDDNGDVLVVHGGAIWRNPVPFLDLGAGYIHREELQGTTVSNDTIRIWTQIRPRGHATLRTRQR